MLPRCEECPQKLYCLTVENLCDIAPQTLDDLNSSSWDEWDADDTENYN